jgi:pimeloyl-ACP methyl ester carboxylesterase
MMIDTCVAVQLGGITQWIRIRGADKTNPVLLLMQQGPGLPIINEVRRFEHLLGLEKVFTVVYWDQRGTGLALRNPKAEISAARMVSDTVSLLELLHDRFGAKTFIAGFSFGATFAARAAEQRPDLVAALIATGMDIDIRLAEDKTYDFVLRTARQYRNRRAIRQLEKVGPPPHLDAKQFATRARWASNFGGVRTNANYNAEVRTLLLSLLRSPDYSVADVIRTVRGITTTQAALLPQLATTDLVRTLPRLDVPIVFAQGRLDQVAPGETTQRFHDSLTAPSKTLVWFEKSAHSPHLEEPEKFRDMLIKIRANVATTGTAGPLDG